MHSEVAWVLVSSRTPVQLQIILKPDYLPNYLSVSYDDDMVLIYQLLILELIKPAAVFNFVLFLKILNLSKILF